MQRHCCRSALGVLGKEEKAARVEKVRGRVAGEEVSKVAGSSHDVVQLYRP